MKELMQSRRVIKFAGRVRDIDRQYEMNNNEDLDNGVYHKFAEEEKNDKSPEIEKGNSLENSFQNESVCSDDEEEEKRIEKRKKEMEEGKTKKKQSELEKIENLIQQ